MLTGAVLISFFILAGETSLPYNTDVLSYGTSLLLTIAVSLDSMGVGIAYGARGTRITALSGIIIALCTAVMMCISMTASNFLAELLPFTETRTLGGIILISIGCWQILQGWRNYINHFHGDGNRPLLHLRIPFLGIVMQILRDPNLADVNWSGTIDPQESILLGGALGLDAFSAGFGAALSGFSLWIVPFVATACVAFVFIGSSLGSSRFMTRWLKQRGFALPGMLLVTLGIWQIL
jgi:putative sporulation protein YtaF